MPVTYYTTFTVKADTNVSYECENCGNSHSYKAETLSYGWQVQAHSSNISEEARRKYVEKALEGLEAKKLQALAAKGFGFKKCPNCGYLQSWMLRSRIRILSLAAFGLTFIILCVIMSFITFFTNLIGPPEEKGIYEVILPVLGVPCGVGLVVSLIVLMVLIILKPNKKFGVVERINEPSVTFFDHS